VKLPEPPLRRAALQRVVRSEAAGLKTCVLKKRPTLFRMPTDRSTHVPPPPAWGDDGVGNANPSSRPSVGPRGRDPWFQNRQIAHLFFFAAQAGKSPYSRFLWPAARKQTPKPAPGPSVNRSPPCRQQPSPSRR